METPQRKKLREAIYRKLVGDAPASLDPAVLAVARQQVGALLDLPRIEMQDLSTAIQRIEELKSLYPKNTFVSGRRSEGHPPVASHAAQKNPGVRNSAPPHGKFAPQPQAMRPRSPSIPTRLTRREVQAIPPKDLIMIIQGLASDQFPARLAEVMASLYDVMYDNGAWNRTISTKLDSERRVTKGHALPTIKSPRTIRREGTAAASASSEHLMQRYRERNSNKKKAEGRGVLDPPWMVENPRAAPP
ncbi:hypothetical protein T484DRAFT_1888909, partial [Baffinella frigidus]